MDVALWTRSDKYCLLPFFEANSFAWPIGAGDSGGWAALGQSAFSRVAKESAATGGGHCVRANPPFHKPHYQLPCSSERCCTSHSQYRSVRGRHLYSRFVAGDFTCRRYSLCWRRSTATAWAAKWLACEHLQPNQPPPRQAWFAFRQVRKFLSLAYSLPIK